ncbi:MAG: LacI family transcriptional regulator [Winogradskyella sp.]|nr:LacI family transcriptional regulator [Winogradskyella sp.]
MVTLKELANLLEVSVSTVSKALNDSAEIGDATKVRVKKLAKELNYQPNRIAQQLKSNKTRTIGVLVPSITNPFFADVLHAIERKASEENYDIIVSITDEDLNKEGRSLRLLANGSVDGFIIAVSRESQVEESYEHFMEIIKKDIPVVLFDRVIKEISCNKVVVDDLKSAYEATQHLINHDQRKHIVLLSNIEELSVGKLRIEGYQKAMTEAGLKPNIVKLADVADPEKSVFNYLKENKKIDGIFSIDHITGIIAINMLKKLDRPVPKNVSVIGFGNEESQLVSSPKISVINQNTAEIGKISTEILIGTLSESDISHSTLTIPSDLVLSESTL